MIRGCCSHIIRWEYEGLVALTEELAKEHRELVIKFLKVINESTLYFFDHPDGSYKLIGDKAGLAPEETKDIMTKMEFYAKTDQLNPACLGTSKKAGNVPAGLKKVADSLVKQEALDKALDGWYSMRPASCEST